MTILNFDILMELQPGSTPLNLENKFLFDVSDNIFQILRHLSLCNSTFFPLVHRVHLAQSKKEKCSERIHRSHLKIISVKREHNIHYIHSVVNV